MRATGTRTSPGSVQLEALGDREAGGGVERLAGKGGYELEAPEARRARRARTFVDQPPAEALAGLAGIHEERADPCRLSRGIEQRIDVGFRLVAAEERAAATPTAARDDLAALLDDEVGAVGDQLRVDAEDVTDRGLRLGRRVVADAEPARRAGDQFLKDRYVRRLSDADRGGSFLSARQLDSPLAPLARGRRLGSRQVLSPRRPVVLLPALTHARVVLIRDVDLNEVDAAALSCGQNVRINVESTSVGEKLTERHVWTINFFGTT